jgi:hypothetical protein
MTGRESSAIPPGALCWDCEDIADRHADTLIERDPSLTSVDARYRAMADTDHFDERWQSLLERLSPILHSLAEHGMFATTEPAARFAATSPLDFLTHFRLGPQSSFAIWGEGDAVVLLAPGAPAVKIRAASSS